MSIKIIKQKAMRASIDCLSFRLWLLVREPSEFNDDVRFEDLLRRSQREVLVLVEGAGEINFTAEAAGKVVMRDKTHKLLFERKLFACRIPATRSSEIFVTLKDEKSKERRKPFFSSSLQASPRLGLREWKAVWSEAKLLFYEQHVSHLSP